MGQNRIVNFVFTLVFIGALVPIGIAFLINADTSGWDPNLVTLWELLPIIGVITLFGAILSFGAYQVGKKRGVFAIAPIWAVPNIELHQIALVLSVIAVALIGQMAISEFRKSRIRNRDEIQA